MLHSLRATFGRITGSRTFRVILVLYLHVCLILMLTEPILSRDLARGQGNDDRIAIDVGLKLHDGDVVGRRRRGGRMPMEEDRVVEHFIEKPRLWSRHEAVLVMADGWEVVLGRGLV